MKRTGTNRLHAFKLDQRGLARVFGELEATIMDAVWSMGEGTVSDVCDRLGDDTNYKTVMTVMNRLVEKRALSRRRCGRAYVYRASESRAAFLERVSRNVVESLLLDFGDLAVAQFVDAVDAVDPALLEELERLVRQRTGVDGAS
jgi:predicted transcriptional regulator